METTINNGRKTRVATIPQYAALKGVSVDKVKGWVKRNRVTALRHNGKTVIDVDASEEDKQRREATVDENQVASPEVLLQRLLVQAEASAQKSYVAQKRWQLVSFISLLLFIGALLIVILLYIDVRALAWDQDRLRMDKHTLTEQLQLADVRVTEVGSRLNPLQNRADRLAADNAELRRQNELLSDKLESLGPADGFEPRRLVYEPSELAKPQTDAGRTKAKVQDQTRLNSILKGIYPGDMTKAELIASLGEPDRTYKDGRYEQLVYFDRSPGRFWFRNGPFVHAAE
ncbi:MAG: hypothetical protein JSV99_03160 [Planctomycetota bacterium]|nr:MAG: hypothetical protein JSV99_03160 [Planctomycetota bacterium]